MLKFTFKILFISSLWVSIFCSPNTYAGGVVNARQQAIAEARQKAIQERMAAERKTLQQNAVQQAQEQAVQNAVTQRQIATQNAIKTKIVQQRNAAQRRNAQRAYQAQTSIRQRSYKHRLQNQSIRPIDSPPPSKRKEPSQEFPELGVLVSVGSAYTDSPKADSDVSSLSEIWEQMEVSSRIWPSMLDAYPKEITVQKYIDAYREQNIIIRKPARHYVALIDSMADQNPSLLTNPFQDVIKYVAVIEYDFENGMDKEKMAYEILGKKAYFQNKGRFK